MAKSVVTCPRLDHVNIPISYFFTHGLEVDYLYPPPITKRTWELGSKYCPDMACAPFKSMLGNFIECIEAGANVLVQTGGACRLGYYGELHQQILEDLGYEIRFVNMAKANYGNLLTFFDEFKKINPDYSIPRMLRALLTAKQMLAYIDETDERTRRDLGFAEDKAAYRRALKQFFHDLDHVNGRRELDYVYAGLRRQLEAIPLKIPQKPLRVGIVGEYYTIMEPYSNHFVEDHLADMGVSVERWMNITRSVFGYPKREIARGAARYAKYDMGATSLPTICKAAEYAERGFDGIIHVKSTACTPEVDVMPALQNISADFKIPILYLSYDTQTGEEGINTRLEAFYDMIAMRKGVL